MLHRSYQKRYRRIFWPPIFVGISVGVLLIALLLRPGLVRSKQNHTAAAAADLIAQTVGEELQKMEESFFAVERDGENITAITIRTEQLNRLQLSVDNALRSRLETGWKYRYSEPLGAILGSELFMTMGPPISQELILLGTANTALGSDIQGVGFGQTRYRIQLSVCCSLQTGLSFGAKQVTVCGDYTVGEMMIFGELPQVLSAVESIRP